MTSFCAWSQKDKIRMTGHRPMVPGGGLEAGVITKGQLEGAVWSDRTVCTPVLAVITRLYPSVKAHNAAHTKLILLLRRKHLIHKRKSGAPSSCVGGKDGTRNQEGGRHTFRSPRGQPPLTLCFPPSPSPRAAPAWGAPAIPGLSSHPPRLRGHR